MSCLIRKSIINIVAVSALFFPSLKKVQAQGPGIEILNIYYVATGSDSTGAFSTVIEITLDTTNPYIEWDRISDSIVRYHQPYVGDQYLAGSSLPRGYLFPFETKDSTGLFGKLFNTSPFIGKVFKSLEYDYVVLSSSEETFNFYKLKNDTLLLLEWKKLGSTIEKKTLFVDSTIQDLKFKTGYEKG